ncbi:MULTISPECIES: hypothetical protein [unclassified Mesorhizobium]|uniref:hypothetical protein n=1 Tax=unclassified Mesorhizobium TaxID=325217 RepID=UPI0033396CEF
MEHHQEAGQHDEQVDAEIRLADDRNLPAGQKHAVPDQHPDRRKRAKPVQAFDARRLDDAGFVVAMLPCSMAPEERLSSR